eukprot:TRINITY_DN3471_c0_g8_i1.p2 TRINITY_DN3471_c0_g8~~TRINITY_DN3471_c0_g8_i1.p2  ORF type:complete len:132 (+),score=27.41 TRINITY_DN3471_c0_g8_i1:2-397(+)
MGAGGSHLSPGGQAAASAPSGGRLQSGGAGQLPGAILEGAARRCSAVARGTGGRLWSLWGCLAPEAGAPFAVSDAEPTELASDSLVWAFNFEDAGGGPEEDRKYLVCLTSAAVRLEAVAPPGTLLLVNVGC